MVDQCLVKYPPKESSDPASLPRWRSHARGDFFQHYRMLQRDRILRGSDPGIRAGARVKFLSGEPAATGQGRQLRVQALALAV